jgi:hypothetical protein
MCFSGDTVGKDISWLYMQVGNGPDCKATDKGLVQWEMSKVNFSRGRILGCWRVLTHCSALVSKTHFYDK